MNVEIDLSLRRFDSAKDYLPYLHKQVVIIDEKAMLSDFYAFLKEKLIDFGCENGCVQSLINGVLVHKDLSISELCNEFGYEWEIQSFAPHATTKDLIVNRSFLRAPLKKVEEICTLTEEDYALFESLIPFCFLTPLFEQVEGYFGEGFFVFLSMLAKRHTKEATELFRLMSSPYNGVMNAMLLKGRIFPYISLYDDEILLSQRAILSGYPLYDSFWVEYAKNIGENI